MISKHFAEKSNKDWIAWGQMDPLYGVATIPGRSRFDANPWTEKEFYDLGSDWERFRDCWTHYGLTSQSCIEIGSGAGRMTCRLARDFDTVTGLDVSPDQVQYARSRVPSNVSLHVTDGIHIPLSDASATAVFSTHVFQHFESVDVAASVFHEIHRVLKPGGSMMIHVPLAIWPSGFLCAGHKYLHTLRSAVANVRAHIQRFAFGHGLCRFPLERWTTYEVDWLYATLNEIGLSNIEVSIVFLSTGMCGGNGKHCFVLARKP